MSTAGNYRDAKHKGARKYVGPPCSTCGGEVRYTSSKSCVMCTSQRHMERKRREKENRHDETGKGIDAADLAND